MPIERWKLTEQASILSIKYSIDRTISFFDWWYIELRDVNPLMLLQIDMDGDSQICFKSLDCHNIHI